MAFVDNLSQQSTQRKLDIFSVPPTQVAIKKGMYEEVCPLNQITNDGPYEFRLPTGPYWLDLKRNFINIQFKITKKNGKNLEAAKPADEKPAQSAGVIAPINLIGKTFFKQVKFFLNGKLVYDSGDKYAYKSYFESELFYSPEAKFTHLASAGYDDEGGYGDGGYQLRVDEYGESQIVETLAPLHIDLFLQDRYLVNRAEIKLELHRNSDAFCLLGTNEDCTLAVQSIKFYVRKVELLDTVCNAIEKNMEHQTAKYPIRRVLMNNLHIPKGATSSPLNNIFSGQLPRRLIFGLVDGDSYRGKVSKNPFNFKHFNLSEIRVVCGGESFPSYPLRLNFSKNIYLKAYNGLFEGIDYTHPNQGNGIMPYNYKGGQCIFVFDLTPDAVANDHWQLLQEGVTSLELLFANGDSFPESGIECIVYAEYDNLIMIDKDRNVSYDFSI